MALFEITPNALRPLDETSFAAEGIQERDDLQRLLRERIEVICPDTFVLTEEFCEWHDSYRRIDQLGLDRDANLVVIELKRTADGGHIELQALRYAAMVSTMTLDKAIDVHGLYLSRLGRPGDAREAILGFLGWDQLDENAFAQDVRIVLVSSAFHPEITTTVLWLNQRGLDIRCVRLRPYKLDGRLLLDVQPIIPLPEAEEYQVQIRQKEDAARVSREIEKHQWNEASFMEALEQKCGPDVRKVAKAILDWINPKVSYVWWGKGKTMGSFIPVHQVGEWNYQLFAAWTGGGLEIYFQALSSRPAFADESMRLALRDRLQKIPSVEIPLDRLKKRPGLEMKLLTDPRSLKLFFEAYDWALQHVREAHFIEEIKL